MAGRGRQQLVAAQLQTPGVQVRWGQQVQGIERRGDGWAVTDVQGQTLGQAPWLVVASAFLSAGQRCSALRLLCLHQAVADDMEAMLAGALLTLVSGPPEVWSTDVGPVIDTHAQARLLSHLAALTEQAEDAASGVHLIAQAPPPADPGELPFVRASAWRIPTVSHLQAEHFGPILHVVHWGPGTHAPTLDDLIDQINASGYGLTLGLHTRMDERIQHVSTRARVGNVYVNRNMVGAVVGSQPFGGHGKSGTGPKAGGAHYLPTLMRLAQFENLGGEILPGPTGEQNSYRCRPRGRVWCTARDAVQLRQQIDAVLATGNIAVVETGVFNRWHKQGVEWTDEIQLEYIDAAVCEHTPQRAHEVARALAAHSQRIIPLVLANSDGTYPAYRLVCEQLVCTNTAAAGGNIELIARV